MPLLGVLWSRFFYYHLLHLPWSFFHYFIAQLCAPGSVSHAGVIVIRGHGSSMCPLRSLSARFAYQEFSRIDRVEHRCVEKYHLWGLSVDWKTVWLNLHLWRFLCPVRDTAWLIAHGILPSADCLIRFGMPVNPSCHCDQAESLMYLFVDSPLAFRIFAWYLSLFRLFTPRTGPLSTSRICAVPVSLESFVIESGSPAIAIVLTISVWIMVLLSLLQSLLYVLC